MVPYANVSIWIECPANERNTIEPLCKLPKKKASLNDANDSICLRQFIFFSKGNNSYLTFDPFLKPDFDLLRMFACNFESAKEGEREGGREKGTKKAMLTKCLQKRYCFWGKKKQRWNVRGKDIKVVKNDFPHSVVFRPDKWNFLGDCGRPDLRIKQWGRKVVEFVWRNNLRSETSVFLQRYRIYISHV